MNFTSQICTTKEQSERLLALGLKRETADCHYEGRKNKDEEWEVAVIGGCYRSYDFPAWSLHRLIEMMPNEIFHEDSTLILGVFGDGVYYADNEYGEVFNSFDGNLYDCVVKCIEWLIKEGYFNKEYLE